MNQSLMRRLRSYEGITYALLFLFPIGGMLVRGWLTNIFNILFLVGLFYLRKRVKPLRREEQIFIILCVIYVAIFFISSLANGWGAIQTHELGTELRFILVIPIYLLIREQADSWRWLLYGSLAGIVFVFSQSVYEVHWEGMATAWGAYSKNIIGPFAALMGFWVLCLWQDSRHQVYKSMILFAFLLALLAVAISGSRGSYVGFVLMFVALLLLRVRLRWAIVITILFISMLMIVYQNSSIVSQGVDRAMSSFKAYIQEPDIAHADIVMDSTEIHMEMWRAARYFFPDHPILGVGPGNYQATANIYVKEGKVNPAIALHGHPHNIFLEALYSKGIIGLVSLLLLLYYPFYVLFKTRKQSRSSASLGMVHIIGISGFSLFDASPILFNNYVSILMLGIAVFFARHMNHLQLQEQSRA